MSERIGRFLLAEQAPPRGKTERWDITSNDGGDLGRVFWWSAWRQYVFEPDFGTVYNNGCLADIKAFLDRCNGTHGAVRRRNPIEANGE